MTPSFSGRPILVNERFLLKDGSVQGFNYDPEIVRNNDECLTGDVVSLMDQQNPLVASLLLRF